MYNDVIPRMCPKVISRQFELDIIVYDIYKRKNSLSVIVGKYSTDEETNEATVDQFVQTHPIFASKFKY